MMMNNVPQTTISQDRVIPDKDIVMKTCTCCEQRKPLDEFKKNRYSNDGYSTQCKACSNAKHAKHRANMTPEQRDKERAYKKRYDRINKKKILARRKARRLELKHMADIQAKHATWVAAQLKEHSIMKPLDGFAPDKINARRKARCLELKQEIDRLEKLKDVI